MKPIEDRIDCYLAFLSPVAENEVPADLGNCLLTLLRFSEKEMLYLGLSFISEESRTTLDDS